MMALAMVLTLSQCKKQEPNNNEADGVSIVLDVRDYGTRGIVNPNTGAVSFALNDVVLVGSGGHYVGTLTCRGTKFMGKLTNPEPGQPLKFFFLGNRETTDPLIAGSTTECTVNISDQTDINNLPVISFAISEEDFTGEGTYHAFFQNKGALVMFDVNTTTSDNTCIYGMNNRVAMSFEYNTFTFSQVDDGIITLPGGKGERWAILLPQDAMPSGNEGSVSSADGKCIGKRGAVPAITANDYLFEGIQVTVHPKGGLIGKFTINADGDQVCFSQGNLQYIGSASTPYWKFADYQWDFLGSSQNGNATDIDRDLFGWGTSGWNNGNTYYQPYSTNSSDGSKYGPVYESNAYYDLTGDFANSDWGVYNAISNGGNRAGLWRTLTNDEWVYVIKTRSTPSGIRYAKATVNDVKGMILLPDDWDASIYTLNNVNGGYFDENVISTSEWITLESHGAVFLPCAGKRNGTTVHTEYPIGEYWSSTHNSLKWAYYLSLSSSYSNTDQYRYYGCSVRLVQDIE